MTVTGLTLATEYFVIGIGLATGTGKGLGTLVTSKDEAGWTAWTLVTGTGLILETE